MTVRVSPPRTTITKMRFTVPKWYTVPPPGTFPSRPGSNPVIQDRSFRAAARCKMAEGLSVKPVRAITWTDVGGREAALIQRCAARDEDACAELVTEHQRMVYQLSLNLLGDHNEALDLSQEVFLRVFRTIHGFRGQSALRTWIYRIVVNQARNRQRWWRRRHKAQQVSLDQHIQDHGELPEAGHGASPDRLLGQKQLAERIGAALDHLPFDQ